MEDSSTEQATNTNYSIKSDGDINDSTTTDRNDKSTSSGAATGAGTGTGISIKEAMSILTARANNGGEGTHLSDTAKSDPMLQQMGQTLDLIASQEWTRSGNNHSHGHGHGHGHSHGDPNPLVLQHQQQQQPKEEHKDGNNTTLESSSSSSKVLIKEALQKQTPYELLQTIFQLQNERVKTFSKFNSGLENTVLKSSGNMSQYPSLVTSTTATFAVLSNSIRDIVRLLEDRGNGDGQGDSQRQEFKDVIKFIKLLQSHEKEKLHLTAALHLELMREQNRELLDIDNGNYDGGSSSGDEKIASLLRQSISSLRGKINDCIENINDVLEELRYAAADLTNE